MKTSFSSHLSEKWLPGILFITTLVLHLLSLVYIPYLNHDAAEYISMGQMIVNGAVPYTGIVDINPPMIFYISSIPVIISKATKVSIPIAGLFFFFSLVLFSGYIFIKALAIEASNPTSRAEKNLFWTFWIFLSFWTYKTDNFAQREQLIFIFLAGFIVFRKARYDAKKIPAGLAILCGVLAAIAVALKPQFILALLFIELIFFVSSSNRWNAYLVPEIIVLVLFGIVYIGHFFIIPGASSYFSYWIPLISRGYSAYEATWATMFATLFSEPFVFINLGVVLVAFILLPRKQTLQRMGLFFAFTGFGLMSLLIYFVQFKGWIYQTLDFHYGCLTALIFLVREHNQLFSKIKSVSLVILIAFNLIGSVTTLYNRDMTIKAPFQFPETATVKVVKQLVPPDQKVLFLGMIVPSAFPQMTYTERIGASRFLTAFPIAFFTNRAPEGDVLPGWEKDDELFFSWLLQDIAEQKPVLVLVDTSRQGHTYSYLFKKNFFQLISNYKCIGRTDFSIVYLRQDENEDTNLLMSNTINDLYRQEFLIKIPDCSWDHSVPSD